MASNYRMDSSKCLNGFKLQNGLVKVLEWLQIAEWTHCLINPLTFNSYLPTRKVRRHGGAVDAVYH